MLDDYPDILKPTDIIKILRLSRTKTYELLRANKIKTFMKNPMRIKKSDLINYINNSES